MAGFTNSPKLTAGRKVRTIGKRTSQGSGPKSRPNNKQARRSWKQYRGQGRP